MVIDMPTLTHTSLQGVLAVARDRAEAHISAAVAEQKALAEVERAVRELDSLGVSIDEISEAVFLAPKAVRLVLARTPDLELADLIGTS